MKLLLKFVPGFLSFAIIFLLTLGTVLIKPPNAQADTCQLAYVFSMVSSDGTQIMLFFNNAVVTGAANPGYYDTGDWYSLGIIYKGKTKITNISYNSAISTTYSIAGKIPYSGGSYTFDYKQLLISGKEIDCGSTTADPIPYDSSKDPYFHPPDTTYYEIYVDTNNTYQCRVSSYPSTYTDLAQCQHYAAIADPINGIGSGSVGSTSSAGFNPCKAGCETAIGTIPIKIGDFATTLLRIALGISGGIALILMVIGSIRVMTSSGDPQKMSGGREMIVAAIAGALFIAFSVIIMQFLGVAIVPIPGLVYNS